MSRARQRTLLGVCALALISVIVAFTRSGNDADDQPPSPPFKGPSTQLQHTAILPTLDTPLPEGKSAIWCASFQVAWRQFQDKVTHGPVKLDGAQDVADRLNAAPSAVNDLTPGSYCAVGGLVRDGAADEIRREMAKLFPDVEVSDYSGYVAIAYAYMQASLAFPLAYYNEPLEFTDAGGEKTKVRAFGIGSKRRGVPHRLEDQPAFLFGSFDPDPAPLAVDLCRDSEPHQVIVARVDRKKTLAEVVDDVRSRTEAEQKRKPGRPGSPRTLRVPMMDWSVTHDFAELEGRRLQNAGLQEWPIDPVSQVIRFRLDKSGADLASEAKLGVKSKVMEVPMREECVFDRPYLILMKRRDAKRPFFAMWVDNAELMSR